jgi:hypothetical protein
VYFRSCCRLLGTTSNRSNFMVVSVYYNDVGPHENERHGSMSCSTMFHSR